MQELQAGPLHEVARRFHDDHLDAYFNHRALDRTLATYSPAATGVGTGRGEWGVTAEAMRRIVERDLGEFPHRIDYTVRDRRFWEVAPSVVVCQALLDLALHTGAHRMQLRDLRHTTVLRCDDRAAPCIVHIHVSFPTDVHGDEEPYPLKEIEALSELVDELIANRTRDLTEAYRRLEHMAIHDALTGLYNRIRLDEKLLHEVLRARRYGSAVAVALLDIDAFKAVNDRFGHLAGDSVLVRLAAMVRELMRETDLAGRWGGEEFMLVLPETSVAAAMAVCERIREAFATEVFEFDGGGPQQLTLSAGVTGWSAGDDTESLFQRADRALYAAKSEGRNRTCTLLAG
ncbi:MAG: GGDEF domain-containing protein [Lysobacteraceae bacterium]